MPYALGTQCQPSGGVALRSLLKQASGLGTTQGDFGHGQNCRHGTLAKYRAFRQVAIRSTKLQWCTSGGDLPARLFAAQSGRQGQGMGRFVLGCQSAKKLRFTFGGPKHTGNGDHHEPHGGPVLPMQKLVQSQCATENAQDGNHHHTQRGGHGRKRASQIKPGRVCKHKN